jgi:hypothetical protein
VQGRKQNWRVGQVPEDEQLYEDNPVQEQELAAIVEPYQGQSDAAMAEDIEKIHRKMAELKQDEKKASRPKSGLEKIKDFISKKNVPDKSSGLTEGVG